MALTPEHRHEAPSDARVDRTSSACAILHKLRQGWLARWLRIPRISTTQSTGMLPRNPWECGSCPLLVIVERDITVAAHGQRVREVEHLVQALVSHACPDAGRHDKATPLVVRGLCCRGVHL